MIPIELRCGTSVPNRCCLRDLISSPIVTSCKPLQTRSYVADLAVLGSQTAKELANAVIPNEYGIDPGGKLRIGSKICSNLMGKILADLANMREESLATAHIEARNP